jgi:hypothetical protein
VASSEGGLFRRLMTAMMRSLADAAADRAGRAASDVRNQVAHGGRFNCISCGKNCWTARGMNAHFLAGHLREVRNTRKGIPKDRRRAWLHARGWREAAGLIDEKGHRTARGRSRPAVIPADGRAHVTHGQLRQLHKHDRDHQKALRHEARATRHHAAGRHGRAEARTRKAEGLRSRWPERSRPAPAARPAPQPHGNGTRPVPARTPVLDGRPLREPGNGNGRAPEPPRPPARPEGRLAPRSR